MTAQRRAQVEAAFNRLHKLLFGPRPKVSFKMGGLTMNDERRANLLRHDLEQHSFYHTGLLPGEEA